MKIQKIKTIKDIGSFVDFQADPQLLELHDKRNIFYGMNGCGKTTLSELLRGVSEGRYTDDLAAKQGSSPCFSIQTDVGEIRNLAVKHSNIKVFNKHFIEENVFCRDGAVPIIHLGQENEVLQIELNTLIEQGKGLRQQRTETISEISKITSRSDVLCQERAKSIKLIIGGNYDKRNIESAFHSVSFIKTNLQDYQITSLRSTISASPKRNISAISFDGEKYMLDQYNKGNDILKKNVTNTIITGLSQKIELWLKSGLDLHEGKEVCEFCKNKISQERTNELKQYFNDEYNEVIQSIDGIINIFPDISIQRCESADFYEDLTSNYIQVKDKIETEINNYKTWKKLIIDEINSKKTKMNTTVSFTLSMFDFNTIKSLLTDINELIGTHNKRTADFSKAITEAKEQLESHYISEIYDNYISYQKQLETNNKRLTTINNNIGAITKRVTEIESQIKPEALALYPINSLIQRILGRNDISLIIKDSGYQIVRNGDKAFNPSEGEKTVIGLAYFFNKLEDQTTDTTDIIVFDDPVTSLDEQIFYNIYGLISNISNCQVLVLTHHFQFLKLFIDWLGRPAKNRGRYFRIKAEYDGDERKSGIVNLEEQIYRYHSEYEFLFDSIYNFIESNRSNPHNITNINEGYGYANMARKIIEIFGAIYCPKGDIKEKLRYCLNMAGMLDKENEIYRFINAFSHNNSIETIAAFDTTIYINNVRSILNEIMGMIQKVNPSHYDSMTNV